MKKKVSCMGKTNEKTNSELKKKIIGELNNEKS